MAPEVSHPGRGRRPRPRGGSGVEEAGFQGGGDGGGLHRAQVEFGREASKGFAAIHEDRGVEAGEHGEKLRERNFHHIGDALPGRDTLHPPGLVRRAALGGGEVWLSPQAVKAVAKVAAS